ncbi:MAG: tRNA pseudouridine(38-40) synthase TruA [Bacillota bacterium]
MDNLKAIVEYDGSNYYGWQRLNNKKSIQGTIEKALKKVYNKKIRIHGSGRTDAKAHATNQVFNFLVSNSIPIKKLKNILNDYLPKDIFIKSLDVVDKEFHSRYSAKSKIYSYKVYNNKNKDVFRSKYSYHVSNKLNIEKIKKASEILIGRHDFSSFSASMKKSRTKIREIYSIDIFKKDKEIIFKIHGNGFLYKMVRTMVGNLIYIGLEKISKSDLKEILLKRDIKYSKFTSPAQGLYLTEVFYLKP